MEPRRSVHSEAERDPLCGPSPDQMLGATLYMACLAPGTGEYIEQRHNSCAMCKRLIINAGIEKVVIRDTPRYRVITSDRLGEKRR